MFRIRSTGKQLRAQVSLLILGAIASMLTRSGSGCIAALEAEKYLVEREDGPEESSLEKVSEAKKGDTKTNGETPEYTSNPLL